MLKEHKKGFKTGVPIRIIYHLIYPFMRNKRIWMFMDLPDMADDNARHLFTYAQDQDKNIIKYFTLDKDSKDWYDMKRIGKVIQYKSIKHRVLALYAEKIITSHPDNNIIYPFWGNYPFFAGLLKSSTIFLQHGITHNDTVFLHYKNTRMSLFVCGAKREYDFIRKTFGYPEGAVQLLGLARFDGLHDFEVKKGQILIMPSWRKNIATPARFQEHMDSEEKFISTDYYRAWKGLLDDNEFRDLIHSHGLKVIFYPHRCMQRFLTYFRSDDPCITMADPAGFDVQELLKESAFLITDYSSIAMDFAYMKKPLMYYQFDKEAFVKEQYGKGYFSYERDGFGPVEFEIGGVKRGLRNYIENGFTMEEKYRNRRDDFFELNDSGNCERNYQAVLKM